MASLKAGEERHNCESSIHSHLRMTDSYIIRTFYTELEKHFCFSCLEKFHEQGYLKSVNGELQPVAGTVESAIQIFSGRVGKIERSDYPRSNKGPFAPF